MTARAADLSKRELAYLSTHWGKKSAGEIAIRIPHKSAPELTAIARKLGLEKPKRSRRVRPARAAKPRAAAEPAPVEQAPELLPPTLLCPADYIEAVPFIEEMLAGDPAAAASARSKLPPNEPFSNEERVFKLVQGALDAIVAAGCAKEVAGRVIALIGEQRIPGVRFVYARSSR